MKPVTVSRPYFPGSNMGSGKKEIDQTLKSSEISVYSGGIVTAKENGVYATSPPSVENQSTHTAYSFKPLKTYRKAFDYSPMGSIALERVSKDATKEISPEKVSDLEEPPQDESDELKNLIKLLYFTQEFGNFYETAIRWLVEFKNLPVELFFSADSLVSDAKLIGLRAHNPVEIEKLENNETREIDMFMRRYKKNDTGPEEYEFFEKYPTPTFGSVQPFDSWRPEVDLSTGRIKRYMVYIKGISDYQTLFGQHSKGFLGLLGFDWEQINTIKELTARGFQGSLIFYIKADTSDKVYQGFVEVDTDKPLSDPTRWKYKSLYDTMDELVASGQVQESFSVTLLPVMDGVEVTSEELTTKIDLGAYLDQSKDVDQKIRAAIGVPASVLGIETAAGMNSDKTTADLKNYNLNTLPSIWSPLGRMLDILVERHVTEHWKMSPTFTDPTSELEKAKTDEIYMDKDVVSNDEVREEIKPGAEPLEEQETEQVTEQGENEDE